MNTEDKLQLIELGPSVCIEFGTWKTANRAFPVVALVTDDARVRDFYAIPDSQRHVCMLRISGEMNRERATAIEEALQKLLVLTLGVHDTDVITFNRANRADA